MVVRAQRPKGQQSEILVFELQPWCDPLILLSSEL